MLIHGDCLEELKKLADNSVDSIVTDPPYGLSFMGKKWDYDVPSQEIWEECLRVLKPGGHLLAFAGTRTQHRMAVRIEDAGFEIRDMIAWIYGVGFPKSLNISKAIDKAAGAEREKIPNPLAAKQTSSIGTNAYGDYNATTHIAPNPVTDAAKQWEGWGTALKPALEPITVARKPLIGTVAENVLTHGTGGINIDGCRVGSEQITTNGRGKQDGSTPIVPLSPDYVGATHIGRFPANLIHDGSEEVVGLFPNDSARFFYCAKASKTERQWFGVHNPHPTVKPIALMRYLCRLVTPPNGTVLDPFMGSGTTGIAAKLELFNFIGIEREAEYVDIARERIASHEPEPQTGYLLAAE